MSDLGQQFKDALAGFASGIAVVTTNESGLLYGLTVTSFASLSFDPPLVLVCINNANRLPAMVDASGAFAVSFLSKEQEAASRYFSRPGRVPAPSFPDIEPTGVQTARTASDQVVVAGALAWLSCALHRAVPEGDHTILIGRVVEIGVDPSADPLLYFRRRYRLLGT